MIGWVIVGDGEGRLKDVEEESSPCTLPSS